MRMHRCDTVQVQHLAEVHHLKEHCDKMRAFCASREASNYFREDAKYTQEREGDVHEARKHQPRLDSLFEDLILALHAGNLILDKVVHGDEHGYVHGVVALHHDVTAYDRVRKYHVLSANQT